MSLAGPGRMPLLFRNVTLVLSDRVEAGGSLRVADGKIAEIGVGGRALSSRDGEEVVNGRGAYLSPGFIDLHVHGAMRRDAMEATGDAFREVLCFHASGGTTAAALTSVAAPHDDILRFLAAIRRWKANPRQDGTGAELLGAHLEGPYFAPNKAGAHRLDFIRPPSPDETRGLLEYADVITQMTLAPELPGALDLIEQLQRHGIIASGGHSDAWDEDAAAAFARGMSRVTHVFNAMSSARRRGTYRVAGLLEFALSRTEVVCELIADGHHVSATLMRMLYRAKGADGICLITDASPGAGLPDGSGYRFVGRDCVVSGGVGLTADRTALAGSTSTMIEGIRQLVRQAGVPLGHAIRMATWNSACAVRREHERGLLAPGYRADLVVLDASLEVVATYVVGTCVHGHPALQ